MTDMARGKKQESIEDWCKELAKETIQMSNPSFLAELKAAFEEEEDAE